jgi:hypothetical protein
MPGEALMMADSKGTPQKDTHEVDNYIMRLCVGNKKAKFNPRGNDRRQRLEDRRSGLDRRTQNISVVVDRRKKTQERRTWKERRERRDRRDTRIEYVGLNDAVVSRPIMPANKQKPGLWRTFLKKTGFLEEK